MILFSSLPNQDSLTKVQVLSLPLLLMNLQRLPAGWTGQRAASCHQTMAEFKAGPASTQNLSRMKQPYLGKVRATEIRVLSCLNHVRLFVPPWTIAGQAPLSMEFSRQENWSGFPFPSPGDLPDPGFELTSLKSPALAGQFFTMSTT